MDATLLATFMHEPRIKKHAEEPQNMVSKYLGGRRLGAKQTLSPPKSQ